MGSAGTDRARRSGPRGVGEGPCGWGQRWPGGEWRRLSPTGTAAVGHHHLPHSEVLVGATARVKGTEGHGQGGRGPVRRRSGRPDTTRPMTESGKVTTRMNLIATSPSVYEINSKRKRNGNGKQKMRTRRKKCKVSLASETRHMSRPSRHKPKILKRTPERHMSAKLKLLKAERRHIQPTMRHHASELQRTRGGPG